MAPVYRIAVIQLQCKPLQAAKNFARAEEYIRSAARQDCHLAVLPEFHLTNWLPADPKFAAACTDWETYVQKYQALAKELKICIVPGSIVRPRAPTKEQPQGLDNVSYFISNDGSILGCYQKKSLWGDEKKWLASGHGVVNKVIDTPVGKIGLLICWDLAYPESWRELVAQGAKMIIVPTLWIRNGASDKGRAWNPSAPGLFVDSILTARAVENCCAVVFANAGGKIGGNYVGLSQITVPYVGPLCKLPDATEGMAIADVDGQIMEDAEENYGLRKDLETGGSVENYRVAWEKWSKSQRPEKL